RKPKRRLLNSARRKKRKLNVRRNRKRRSRKPKRRLLNSVRQKKRKLNVRPKRKKKRPQPKKLKMTRRHQHQHHTVRSGNATVTALGMYTSVVSRWASLSATSGAMLPTGQVLPKARGLTSAAPLLSVPSYSLMLGRMVHGAQAM